MIAKSNERSDGELAKIRGKMEVAMKTFLIAFAAILLLVGGDALVTMNNACKTTHHSWCRSAHISGNGSGQQNRLRNSGPAKVHPAQSS